MSIEPAVNVPTPAAIPTRRGNRPRNKTGNGFIVLGVREAAYEIGCSQGSISSAMRELDDADLARPLTPGVWRRQLAFPAGLEGISPPPMRMWKDESTGKVTARIDGSEEVMTFETEAEARAWADQHRDRTYVFSGFESFLTAEAE